MALDPSTTSGKKTIFVGGLNDDQATPEYLISSFSTFGDIIDVQIPSGPSAERRDTNDGHRGFAFVTFGTQLDAQDAIDNMDLNELGGRVIRVSLAKPPKGGALAAQNGVYGRPIWESEEWLKRNAKPVGSGGVGSKNPGNIESANDEDAQDAEEGDAMEES